MRLGSACGSLATSLLQCFGSPVLVEPLGRPLAGVLLTVGPVGLLLPVALVEDGLVALDVDQLGDESGLDASGPAVDVGLELLAEAGDHAPDDSLVLEAEEAAGAFGDRADEIADGREVVRARFR